MGGDTEKQLVGRAEFVSFPELDIAQAHARIDTGARTSSISVVKVRQHNDRLEVFFYGQPNKSQWFDTFEKTVVFSSNGQAQERFKVRLLVVIAGKRVRGWFTLADRSSRVYPVLIGRNVLHSKFVVDVTQGRVPTPEERAHIRALHQSHEEQE